MFEHLIIVLRFARVFGVVKEDGVELAVWCGVPVASLFDGWLSDGLCDFTLELAELLGSVCTDHGGALASALES